MCRDLLPVLHHDPWVDTQKCTYKDNSKIEKKYLLRDYTLAYLQEHFVCGKQFGSPPTPILALSKVLQKLQTKPSIILNFDIKYDPQYTHPSNKFLRAITKITKQYKVSRYIVSSSHPQLIRTFQTQDNIITLLDFPNFGMDSNRMSNFWVALQTKIGAQLGFVDYIKIIESVQADGISLPYQIISKGVLYSIQSKGYLVQVWTPNEPQHLKRFCTWPIDILISDYPHLAPCFSKELQRTAKQRIIPHFSPSP